MIIGNYLIYFPIVKFDTLITYYEPRRLTSFEWLILEIVYKFKDDYRMANVPFLNILSSVFCIPDADKLVMPSIDSLLSLNVINCNRYFTSFKDINIGDVSITPFGEESRKKGEIPGKEKEITEELYYDYVKGTFVKRTNISIFLKDSDIAKDDKYNELLNIFSDIYSDDIKCFFPESLISQHINEEEFSWLSCSCEIKNIEKRDMEILWKPVNVTITLADYKNIHLYCSDEDYSKYLTTIDNRYLVKLFNLPIVLNKTARVKNHEVSENIFSDDAIEDMFLLKKNGAEDILKELIKHKKNKIIFMVNDKKLVNYVNEVNENNLIVVFDEIASDILWKFDDIYKKGIVRLPIEIFDPRCLYIDVDGDNIYSGVLNVTMNESPVYLDIGYNLKKDYIVNETEELLNLLDEYIMEKASENTEIAFLRMFWCDVQSVWSGIYDVLGSTADNLEKLYDYGKRLRALRPQEEFSWKEDCIKLLKNRLEKIEIFKNITEIENQLDILSKNSLVREEKLHKVVLENIANRIYAIKTVNELDELINIFLKYDKNLKEVNLSMLYSQKLVKEYFKLFNSEKIYELLKHRTKFESALYKLKKEEENIKKNLKIEDLSQFISITDFKRTVKKVNVNDILHMIERWNKALEKLKDTIDCYREAVSKTNLEWIEYNLAQFELTVQKYSNRIPDKYKKIYVIDTNIFIDKPDVIYDFNEDDYIILSAKVIDELDRLKHSKVKENAENARLAINNIKSYHRDNLTFEKADISLLSVDYDASSSDNLILSVALKFLTGKPILLTNDSNLRIKAINVEEIQSQSLSEFLESKSSNGNKRKKNRKV